MLSQHFAIIMLIKRLKMTKIQIISQLKIMFPNNKYLKLFEENIPDKSLDTILHLYMYFAIKLIRKNFKLYKDIITELFKGSLILSPTPTDCMIMAQYISSSNYFDDKIWATEIYKKALCKAEADWSTNCDIAKSISNKKYLASTDILITHLRQKSISIQDVDLTDYAIYSEIEKTSKKHGLDIADAFQLVTLKAGFPSAFDGESKTMLITGDKRLAGAARDENLRVWDIINEPIPA